MIKFSSEKVKLLHAFVDGNMDQEAVLDWIRMHK